MRITAGLIAGACLAGALAGCVKRGPATGESTAQHNAEVALEVENHGWSDVVIYLVRGNSVERIGMAGSLKTSTFVFPYRRVGTGGETRLRAYPIGGPAAFTSENLYVQPGQWIKWTLESDLDRSFLAIY